MRFKEYLAERKYNDTLVIVDVQPSYINWICFFRKFQEFLEQNEFKKIIWFFNGPELGMESTNEVKEWLFDKEFPEELIDDIQFEEKDYGFFRAAMDTGMDEDELVDVIKLMVKKNINDIRDFGDKEWKMLEKKIDVEAWKEFAESGDMIGMPGFHGSKVTKDLKKGKLLVCGGGRDECLAEILLYLDGIGARYNTLDKFIY